jgi:hypothetical protein
VQQAFVHAKTTVGKSTMLNTATDRSLQIDFQAEVDKFVLCA